MAYLNQLNLIGNVGSDPEVRYIDTNPQAPTKFATFKVATTERYKDRNGEQKEQTQWHLCTASGTIADVVEKYLKKGAAVYIGGKLTYRQWEDKDGGKHTTTEVRVFTIQMLDRKPKNAPDGASVNPDDSQDAPTKWSAKGATNPVEHPEDLPF